MIYDRIFRDDSGNTLVGDVYTVLDAFQVNPVLVNAVKKTLCPGGRGGKGEIQDLEEAIRCITKRIGFIRSRQGDEVS